MDAEGSGSVHDSISWQPRWLERPPQSSATRLTVVEHAQTRTDKSHLTSRRQSPTSRRHSPHGPLVLILLHIVILVCRASPPYGDRRCAALLLCFLLFLVQLLIFYDRRFDERMQIHLRRHDPVTCRRELPSRAVTRQEFGESAFVSAPLRQLLVNTYSRACKLCRRPVASFLSASADTLVSPTKRGPPFFGSTRTSGCQ